MRGDIVIYQTQDGLTQINVKFEDETVWLTQAQLVELYQTSKSNISEHIKHIFEEGELDEISVVRNFRTTATDGKSYNTKFYNLDMIISLGYRIKSLVATQFRRWATDLIKEYLKKGYALDDKRLKELGGGDYWKDLLDRILSSTGKEVLEGAGSISNKQALEKAEAEYQKFIQKNLSPVEKAYLEVIKNLEQTAKKK